MLCNNSEKSELVSSLEAVRNFLKAILDPKKLSNFFLSPILPKQNETKQKIIQILALFCQVSSGQCFISIPPETIKKPGVF